MSQRIWAILFLIVVGILFISLCASDRIPNIGGLLHIFLYTISGIFILIGVFQGYNVWRTQPTVTKL